METTYTPTAKVLHWTIVALIVTEYTIVALMPDLHGNEQPTTIVNYHMSVGITILLVMLVRIIWRMTHTPPPYVPELPRLQRIVSRATHDFLYLLLTIMPILGWTWASARGWSITLFGLIPLPALVAHGSSIGRMAGGLHSLCGGLIVLLAGLHIAAALYHHFYVKDSVLSRMMPKWK